MSELTRASSKMPDLEDYKRRAEEFRRKIESVPLEVIEIDNPKDCPDASIGRRYCEHCEECRKTGMLKHSSLQPEQYRREYHTAKCLQRVIEEDRTEKFLQRITDSGLVENERGHTFANWKVTPQNKRVYDALKAWNRHDGIYLVGETTPANPTGNGTGKSYALHSLTIELCESTSPVFCRTVDFLKELRATYDREGAEYEVLDRYALAPILLWDDLGKEAKPSDWACEKFYYVIDERCRRDLPVVISSNVPLTAIEQRFGDNFGPAIASRLIGMCPVRLKLGGADWRMK